MGFLGLVPANKLAATYDPVRKTLTLFAEGRAIEYTSGIHFVQDREWVGGYKFNLYGWTGPLHTPRDFRAYQCTNPISMELMAGTKAVIVVDANHPEGIPVEVHYLGLGAEHVATAQMTVPTENHVQTMDQAANSARTIRVAADGTFTIGQSSSVMLEGSISVEADSAYVSMENAGISYKGEPQIQWTFKALKAGQTTVTVVVSGGIATFILRIPYNVVIS